MQKIFVCLYLSFFALKARPQVWLLSDKIAVERLIKLQLSGKNLPKLDFNSSLLLEYGRKSLKSRDVCVR